MTDEEEGKRGEKRKFIEVTWKVVCEEYHLASVDEKEGNILKIVKIDG